MTETAIAEEGTAVEATEGDSTAPEAQAVPTAVPDAEAQETAPEAPIEGATETPRPAWLQDVLNYRPDVPDEPAKPGDAPTAPDFTESSLDQHTIDQIKNLIATERTDMEGKIRDEIGATRTEVRQHRAAEVEKALGRTTSFLDNHFYPEVLANDPEVMGNKTVRGYVDFFAGKFTEQAVQIARQYGDTGRAEFIESPIFQALVVGGAKELHRITSGAPSDAAPIEKPAAPAGAHVETSASPAGDSGTSLDPEVRAWLKKRGISEADHIKDIKEYGSDVAYDGE